MQPCSGISPPWRRSYDSGASFLLGVTQPPRRGAAEGARLARRRVRDLVPRRHAWIKSRRLSHQAVGGAPDSAAARMAERLAFLLEGVPESERAEMGTAVQGRGESARRATLSSYRSR
jgi:hypothetical protein